MISVREAIQIIRQHCQPCAAVTVPLAQAGGRILREAVDAPEDMPPFDRSAVDGYAVLEADPSQRFTVTGEIRPGEIPSLTVAIGQAVRIYTGAALPPGDLEVIMQEEVETTGQQILIKGRDQGPHIRFRGEDLRQGARLLNPGTILGAGEVALLAAIGCSHLEVAPRLRVNHWVTGNEIVPPDQIPLPGQIRDSNSALLRALLREQGAEAVQGRLPEESGAARQRLAEPDAAQADLWLISGGASAGKYDFTRQWLEEAGFEIHISQVNVRPGKPMLFATRGPQMAFGLPGNPLSHWVCYHLFVAAALAARQGAPAQPAWQDGWLKEPMADCAHGRETYWPACLTLEQGRLLVAPVRWQSSGDVSALAGVNGLLQIPAHTPKLPKDSLVRFVATGARI